MKDNTNTVRTYNNSIVIHFKQSTGYTNNLTDIPHYKEWLSFINFLENRGFIISENPTYKEHYDVLSKFHKIGYKNNVVVLLDIEQSTIKVEFGNISNLWKDMKQSFWSNKSDSRYTHLSYLEDKAVELEIKRVVDRYVIDKGFNYDLDSMDVVAKLSVEEQIIKDNNNNKHIHGYITCLDDIGKFIAESTYDYNQNSWDKNKKRIICGDIKCFYDTYGTRRLFIGKAYHNINNMWWILTNGKKYNKAAFELFDYDSNLPKRLPTTVSHINNLLQKYENKMDYEKCIKIKRYADKIGLKIERK